MNLDWLLSPIAQYLLIGFGLLGSLVLWVSFKKDLQSVRTNAAQSGKSIEEKVQDLSESVQLVRESLQSRSSGNSTGMLMSGIAPGINPAKRAQALLLHIHGEQAGSIAAALEVPENEIALLLKVNRLLHPEA
jgi:hypothetical protein